SRNAQNCVDRTNCDRTNCDRMNCDRTNRIVNRMRAAREASRAARILFTILFILSQFVLSQFVLSQFVLSTQFWAFRLAAGALGVDAGVARA
ncbi:MAG TPA: hypothetical protein VKA84_02525, partial [Gemmatimonadaceae bacterium]|nr:hypothetical protein [Gemmatimonadaceae bacterium]